MAETTQIVFSHKEIVEALLRERGDIKTGFWGLSVKFGFKAANIGSQGNLVPGAMVTIVELGLQRFNEETNISVDAAKVGRKPSGSPAPKKKRAKR